MHALQEDNSVYIFFHMLEQDDSGGESHQLLVQCALAGLEEPDDPVPAV